MDVDLVLALGGAAQVAVAALSTDLHVRAVLTGWTHKGPMRSIHLANGHIRKGMCIGRGNRDDNQR